MTVVPVPRGAAGPLRRPNTARRRSANGTTVSPHWWEPATRASHVLSDAAGLAAITTVACLATGTEPLAAALGGSVSFAAKTALGLRRLRRHRRPARVHRR